MSIIDTIKSLIKGSPDAQAATAKMIEILATEAIKTGQPDALVAVAAQWENLLEGNSRALAPASVDPSVHIDYTTAATLKPLVIKIMQQAYLGGVVEITNGTLKKALNTYMLANGGWKDADLQDNDPKPGIQPLWWSTLSCALYELRQQGDVSNDARAWRTYQLAPHHLPTIEGRQEAPALSPAVDCGDAFGWETVAS